MVVNKNGVDYTFNSAGRVSKIDNQPSGQIIKYTYVNNQISESMITGIMNLYLPMTQQMVRILKSYNIKMG